MIIDVEEWVIVKVDGVVRLQGILKGHPTVGNSPSCPSLPVSFNKETSIFLGMSGKLYRLGQPKKDYEKQFPGSRDRFIKQLEKLPNFSPVI